MFDNFVINKDDKNKIKSFIEINDLDFDIVDNDFGKFSIVSEDKKVFYFYKNEKDYILVKYDRDKDKDGEPLKQPYEYYTYDSFNRMMNEIKYYDDNLFKKYWDIILGTMVDDNFIESKYNDNWYGDIINEDYKVENSNKYKYLIYEDINIKPKVINPNNQLDKEYGRFTEVNKLYFEIFPISCEPKKEVYLFRMLSNNDELFKEYISYYVYKKKGLKLFVDLIFKEVNNS
jgi:hypothetical protein